MGAETNMTINLTPGGDDDAEKEEQLASVGDVEGEGPNSSHKDTTSHVQTADPDIAALRRLIAPLSKEQLIELLATAALGHPDVNEAAQKAVVSSPACRRLMIRNISFSTRDDAFRKFFTCFGELDDAAIVREKDGKSRGYGFVTFRDIAAARGVLESPLYLDRRQMMAKLAADPFADFTAAKNDGAPPSRPSGRRKLFVRNLSEETDSDALKQVFGAYGTLDECAVVSDPNGRSRGYGFVTFRNPESAVQAVQQPQRIIRGRVAFVAFATPTKNSRNQAVAPSGSESEKEAGGSFVGDSSLARLPSLPRMATPSRGLNHTEGLAGIRSPQLHQSSAFVHHPPYGVPPFQQTMAAERPGPVGHHHGAAIHGPAASFFTQGSDFGPIGFGPNAGLPMSHGHSAPSAPGYPDYGKMAARVSPTAVRNAGAAGFHYIHQPQQQQQQHQNTTNGRLLQ